MNFVKSLANAIAASIQPSLTRIENLLATVISNQNKEDQRMSDLQDAITADQTAEAAEDAKIDAVLAYIAGEPARIAAAIAAAQANAATPPEVLAALQAMHDDSVAQTAKLTGGLPPVTTE